MAARAAMTVSSRSATPLDRGGEVCDAPRTIGNAGRDIAMGKDKSVKAARQLEAARDLARELGTKLDLNASLRLWDGSLTPLGRNVTGPFEISIADAGVIGSLLRWPTLDNFIRHYVDKGIDFSGGTLIDLGSQLNQGGRSVKLKGRDALGLARRLYPFLTARSDDVQDDQGFEGEITGRRRKTADNKDYIQFHYDLSNDFYALFLDPEMVYSCAYYTDWNNDVAQAQRDKLEMICRKLRLKPGERFLDIGCGWGGLICHAAKNYGVTAHGITLSEEQLAFAKEKIKRLGLEDKVTVELKDYSMMSGAFDKIASIGMYEHIGLKNIPGYMQKMQQLLTGNGLFLNHAIARRAPKQGWFKRRMRPEQKAIAKYIFPGGELDDIGHSIFAMERAGFEIQDVEAWRLHYARTCKLWCERLTTNREEALKYVSEEKYRIWVAYLAGVSLAFSRGTLRIFQTLVSKNAKRPPAIPPTRADLYR
jgi:cyclopropane-fatty-acyl-phospholipid synthase